MNEWARMLDLGYNEMKEYSIGSRVKLVFAPFWEGRIIEQQEPYGLLSPGYKCQWDNGEITPGFLKSSEITLLEE